MTWAITEHLGFRHVMPEDEWDRHDPTDCKCGATPDEDDERLIIHASFDGREFFERGERKPS